MILFLNTFITEKRIQKTNPIKSLDNENRLDIFKYMLLSYSTIKWSKVIIYYDLDENFKFKKNELNQYIKKLFKNLDLYDFRNTNQKMWQKAIRPLINSKDDNLIWFSCEDDHIYIDYSLDYLNYLLSNLNAMKSKYEFISCYFSHWPEMISLVNKKNLKPRHQRKIIQTTNKHTLIKWKNIDGVSIINQKLLIYWWFNKDYGDKILRRTDDPSGNEVSSPIIYTIIPHKEIVRHYDSYPHVRISFDLCPKLFIPDGIFNNKINIDFKKIFNFNKKINYTSVVKNYSLIDEVDKVLLERTPLFWQNKISTVSTYKNIPKNYYISLYNRYVIALACSGNALGRGSYNPLAVISSIKDAFLIKYEKYDKILIFRDSLLSWRYIELRDYLYFKYTKLYNILNYIKKILLKNNK